MAAGEAKSDLIWLIGVFVVLGIAWLATGGPSRPEATGGPFIEPPAPLGGGRTYGTAFFGRNHLIATPLPRRDLDPKNNSISQSTVTAQAEVKINRGSAGRALQVNQEYVVLEASRQNSISINITGWRLSSSWNPKHQVIIPFATKIFIGGDANPPNQPIILAPGDRAIIVTGRMPNASPYNINANFQVNTCSGYLEGLPNYQFQPTLSQTCPKPSSWPGVNNLGDDCYQFVKRLNVCHTPEFTTRNDIEYVDSSSNLSTVCKNYLRSEFNYNRCVNLHYQDQDFFQPEWRVFLNQSLELWAPNRETISLYNTTGGLVSQINY